MDLVVQLPMYCAVSGCRGAASLRARVQGATYPLRVNASRTYGGTYPGGSNANTAVDGDTGT
jgi:hypothetical protein